MAKKDPVRASPPPVLPLDSWCCRLARRRTAFAGTLLLLCATLAAYLPALRGGLLWDDHSHITAPGLQSWHGLWRIWFELDATQQYYPLLHSAFWIEHRLWGDSMLGYHLANVLLHATAACLVILLVRRLALPGAWLAGFVFALHPVAVETVAWITEQKNTLSAVFYLAAALVYLDFDRTRRRPQYLLALALFVLALLTKTVTATLPAALLVILWQQRGRLEWRRDVLPLAPWFALGTGAGLFTAWVERTLIGARGAAFSLTFLERCLLAGRAIWFYLGTLVWPSGLMFFYPRWTLDTAVWWQYLFPCGEAALAALLWLKARSFLAGLLFFSGTLFPVLGFFNVYPFLFSYVADHFQYLASLGVIVPLAAVLTVAGRRIRNPWLAPALAVLLLATLDALTWRQSRMYRDSETLYRATLERNPSAWLAHNNLAVELLDVPGRLPEATGHLEATLRLNPQWAEAHMNLGIALAQTPGRQQQAIAEYEAALRIDPKYAKAHVNLGNTLLQMSGRLPQALAEYDAALRISPDLAEAHYSLGAALSRLSGRTDEAAAHLEAAARARPDWAQAHMTLANTLAQTPGHREQAIAEYRESLRLNSDWAEAHMNLGIVLAQTPDGAQPAIAEYETALRIDPRYAKAHMNLGNTLSQIQGRVPQAIAEYEAALGIDPDLAEAHYNLGNALLHIPGRVSEAAAEYRAALRLKPAWAEAHFNLGVALLRTPGRMAEAMAECEAALRIKSDFEPARQLLEKLRTVRPQAGRFL